jgi:hypothetical protein
MYIVVASYRILAIGKYSNKGNELHWITRAVSIILQFRTNSLSRHSEVGTVTHYECGVLGIVQPQGLISPAAFHFVPFPVIS